VSGKETEVTVRDLLLENGRHKDVVLLWYQHQRLATLTTLDGEQLQKPAKILEGFLRVEVVDGHLNVKPRPDVTVECHLKLLHATHTATAVARFTDS